MDETYRFLTCGSYVSNLIVRTPTRPSPHLYSLRRISRAAAA